MGSACGVYPKVNGKVTWPWLVRRELAMVLKGQRTTLDMGGLGGDY